jgi:DNA-binding NarL/FixJ family response regulator
LSAGPELSPREWEIARLVATGLKTAEIAHRLGISHRTVDQHRAKAMQKLQVTNAAGLASELMVLLWSRPDPVEFGDET